MDWERLALCPKCGHEVREHQPHQAHQPMGHAFEYVGCMECECIITVLAKLRAWGGPRK